MDQRNICKKIAFLALALFLTACSPADLGTSLPLPTMTSAPLSLDTDWLSVAFPRPGEILTLEHYNDPNLQRQGFVVLTHQPSTICFDIIPDVLIEQGDFWEAADVLARTTVTVDDVPRAALRDTLSDGMAGTALGADGGSLLPGETPIAVVGGPYGWCVEAVLTPGDHRAEIRFERSSGEILSYCWTFTLVDE